jgi:hypothetical protein
MVQPEGKDPPGSHLVVTVHAFAFTTHPKVYDTLVLAYMLDSLVRVSRRVGRDHFVNIARRACGLPRRRAPPFERHCFSQSPPAAEHATRGTQPRRAHALNFLGPGRGIDSTGL